MSKPSPKQLYADFQVDAYVDAMNTPELKNFHQELRKTLGTPAYISWIMGRRVYHNGETYVIEAKNPWEKDWFETHYLYHAMKAGLGKVSYTTYG